MEVPISMNNFLGKLTSVLAVLAVACSIGLLARGTKLEVPLGFSPAVTSAVPLLIIGASFLLVQVRLRPRWMELLRNLLLASAFILWGIVQLLEQNALSKKLGDVVIALYVLDLAWLILGRASDTGTIQLSSLKVNSSGERG